MPLDPDNEKRLSGLLNNAFSTWKEIEPLFEEKARLSPTTEPEPRNDPPGTFYWEYYNQRRTEIDQEVTNKAAAAGKKAEQTIDEMPPDLREVARETFNLTCYGQFGTSEKWAQEYFENELAIKVKESIDPPKYAMEGLTPEEAHEMELQWSIDLQEKFGIPDYPEPEEPEYEPDDD